MAYDYPIIVIGAGAGGLVVAIGSAKAGKKVLLIERGHYGGDCTNFGCIPSKSLIAAAEVAHSIKDLNKYGLNASIDKVKNHGALARTRSIIDEILGHEDPEALKKLGVDTVTKEASFVDSHTLKVGDKTVTGAQIVIATGSRPFLPKIHGLTECDYHTNETIFDLKEIPKTLGVIGGGPIGCELAQAFQRLGTKVTLFQHGLHLLKKEDPTAAKVITETFRNEGIRLKTGLEIATAKKINSQIALTTNDDETTIVDHLLVATGRRPNIESLNLENAGVKTHTKGIEVDSYGRTSASHIWAVGDVTGRALFTHIAENEARTVLTNLLLPWPFKKKLDLAQPIPRVTFTDPEVAAVGLTEQEAIEQYGFGSIATYTVPFKELDRAITAGRTEGFLTVVTKKWSSKILGATIVGPRAGEMLAQITTAMYSGTPLRKLASLIHAYPTYSLAVRKAADQWLTKTILGALKRK